MDFAIAPQVLDLKARVREFLRQHLFPLERGFCRESDFGRLEPELHGVRQLAKSADLWAPQLPESLGGQGLEFLEFAHISEELGHSPWGHYVMNCHAPDAGNLELLQDYGTDEQKREWLVPLAAGEIRSCFSMTEPNRPGSNPVWMETRAERIGNEYVINGHKWFTTAADGASFAIVMAVTDRKANPHERATLFLVPTNSPGFHHTRNISCMGDAGKGWMSHAEIEYKDCRVPIENRIGAEGAGFAMAQARLGPGRIHHCMRWLGISERAFDIMCRRANHRDVSPGEALATRQTVQNWIAESRVEIDAARLLVLQTAWKIDCNGQRDARIDISMIKYFVAGTMMRVLDRAIQTCGALGISDDTVLSLFYRLERGARIYDGPDEVHKAAVARRILKTYQEHH